jgi:hypothetical protein
MDPVDLLLHWLSTRESVGPGTLVTACLALAQRFAPANAARDPRPAPSALRERYCGPLHRLGHVEERDGRWGAVPPVLVWTDEAGGRGWGHLCGARSRRLKKALQRTFGPDFEPTQQAGGPDAWDVVGDRAKVREATGALSPPIALVDEPGERLLAALPGLEQGLLGGPPYQPAGGRCRWQRLAPQWARGRVWADVEEAETDRDGLYREVGPTRPRWFLVRSEEKVVLGTSERRSIGWWAQVVRDRSPRLVYHVERRELRLPAVGLPPPVLVDRALRLASGRVPVWDRTSRARCYQRVGRRRAEQVARILGLKLESSS